jgi:hypothetical protein
MAMPAMPGAGLAVIEAEFILGGLKTILERATMSRKILFCLLQCFVS